MLARSLLLILILVGASACPRSRPDVPPLRRGTFFVDVTELLQDRETEEWRPTDPNVAQELITRKLLLHGFQLADSRAEARYVVEGTLKAKYHKTVTFDWEGSSTLLEHQYEAEFLCQLTDTHAPDPVPGEEDLRSERFDIPYQVNGRTSDENAKLDIRRMVATTVAIRMVNGRLLGNPEVTNLIESLGAPDREGTYRQVVAELTALGPVAVPYLLDTLSDTRPVQRGGDYPGLEEWNRDSFKYYHVADLALGEILRRASFLALDSPDEYRHRVQLGWTWVWEDIQGIPEPYRDRPHERNESVKATRAGG